VRECVYVYVCVRGGWRIQLWWMKVGGALYVVYDVSSMLFVVCVESVCLCVCVCALYAACYLCVSCVVGVG